MGKQWYYLLFLLWFAYLIVSSILLFTRGFLLTRDTQNTNSTCASISEITCLNGDSANENVTQKDFCLSEQKISTVLNDVDSASIICLPPKAKVILLVIDALRYDFAAYNDKITNALPYQNKLPVMKSLLDSFPENSRLYKFIADPPTTTMQRLKGLTTGSLPTFIDAGSNFATSEINEDNIIDQLIRHNKSVVFMGDDTWTGLYPRRFSRSYPYPSFNVWDLDTVDNGVISHLYPEINKNDWDLLIAHFLGVDHCGHRYGPNHSEMSRKLNEMNTVIENTVEKMSEDSMLFVFGDHGMTVTGDHGGSSDDEITAALFVYSKQKLVTIPKSTNTVKQVDIVPTLSTILGVSIPFSNLGVIILDSLPSVNSSVEMIADWRSLLFSVWSNTQQMIRYIKHYSSTSQTFKQEQLTTFYEKYTTLKKTVKLVQTEQEFINFAETSSKFLIELRSMCEEVWVQFESYSMTRGLLFIFLSTSFVYIIADGIPAKNLNDIIKSSFLTSSYIAMFLAALVSCVLYYLRLIDNLSSNIFFLTCLVSQFMLAVLVVQNWETISLNWYDKCKKNKIQSKIFRLVMLSNLLGVFSNSYVIEESFVLLFSLVTITIVGTFRISRNSTSKLKIFKWSKYKLLVIAVGVCFLVRSSMYFWKCREEQDWCFETNSPSLYAAPTKNETSKLHWALTVICLGLFVTITKIWLRNCGNLNGFSLTVTFAKYVPTVMVVCTGGYWVLHRLPADTRNKLVKPWQTNILAWVVYGLSSLGILCVLIKPMCIYVVSNKKEIPLERNSTVIPQLFRYVKGLFEEKPSNNDNVPVVWGLGTVYSSTFVIIAVYLTLIFALLLGDAVAPSAVIMFLTAAFILIVTSVLRIEKASTIEELLEIPNSSLLIWVIVSQYFFYGTGHQPTFPNINWEAAFIGNSGTFTNHIIPGALIIINTFCSHILMGFLLPLLLILPFTVFVMLPSVISKKTDLQAESSRGEVLLYERDTNMVTSTFTTSCRYIICHSLRVFACMLSATVHCRHLMVWKIFAPKLIFECLGMFVTLGSVITGYLILNRVNQQVDNLVISLNKQTY